ncbi:MAG: hypothetical protein JST46_17665 [Bacteroidetes bacterium]|nr:hypothetical protein [Bacteroidota bacterium]
MEEHIHRRNYTLSDFRSDAEILYLKFKRHDPDRIDFLDSYLKSHLFTDEELFILNSFADDFITQDLLTALETSPLDEPNVDNTNQDQVSAPYHYELCHKLVSRLKLPTNPLPKLSPRLVVDPSMIEKFDYAERLMISRGHIRRDGTWNGNQKELIAFINSMCDENILRHTNEDDMNTFYSTRYNFERASKDGLWKLNKFRKQKSPLFDFVLEHLRMYPHS